MRFVELDGDHGNLDLVAAAEEYQRPVAGFGDWVFMSDVCKHCTHAGCLDACPTGALVRTEFNTVVLQPDVCNGCGYCIPSCPFGVVDRDKIDGRAAKCTLCYDRLEDGLEPACAKACPTDSIQFGPYDELLDVAAKRVATLHERGIEGAYLYGAHDEPQDQVAGGLGAFFLLTEPPERYGLPAQADSPIQENVIPATLTRGRRRARRGGGRRGLVHVEPAAMSSSEEFRPAIGVPGEPAFGERRGREGRPAHRQVRRRPLVVRVWRRHRVRRRDAGHRGDP